MRDRYRGILYVVGFFVNVWYRTSGHGYADLEPEFTGRISNATAVQGQNVTLSCNVENLGSYKVAWIFVETKTILSIHTHMINRNYRISSSNRDNQRWNLHIADVQEKDAGRYMCQINTVPMKNQIGFLEVIVPPQFLEPERSAEVLAREGTNVTLSCAASGNPQPMVTWHREDGQHFHAHSSHHAKNQKNTFEGEKLTLSKVSRLHMGTYICTAENGVPPSMSRRTQLYVHFPPMLWIPNQLIGGRVGSGVVLECLVEAFPRSLNYWTRHDGQLLVSGPRHAVDSQESAAYKTHMKLTLLELRRADFGTYTCLARNSLGSTEGAIRLYEIVDPHSSTTAKSFVEDERLQMLDDSLSRERNFPNQSPDHEQSSTQDTDNNGVFRHWLSPTLLSLSAIIIFQV